ncbi:FAD-dependent oxidoreductase [Cerasicoccus maritimus]|uniref:FAD-dependent oxidoreductase n=1 Tax=Cerasicoccus maritimus TaxID=490089 RepID=UPI003CCE3818
MHDVIIFGGGPAGYPTAIQAARMEAKTLLVDKRLTTRLSHNTQPHRLPRPISCLETANHRWYRLGSGPQNGRTGEAEVAGFHIDP